MSTLESAGQTFSTPQKKVIDDTIALLKRIADHYRTLSVNSSPGAVLPWLLNRNKLFSDLAGLGQEAKEVQLDWLAEALHELSLRVPLLRFFNPTKLLSAFVALPDHLQTFLAEAAANGYFFTGIASEIWKERVTVAGLTVTRPLYQCFAAPLLLFFLYADSGCAGAQNVGMIGYIGETKSGRAPRPLWWLYSPQWKVVVTRNVQEVEALKPLHQFVLGYVP